MNSVIAQPIGSSRAKRLKALTHQTHDALDKSIMRAASFADLAGYTAFVEVQYLFHRDIDALYDSGQLQALLPDLAQRRRLPLIEADLADLGREIPRAESVPAFNKKQVDIPTALGWLYVAEGSNMGAALLRKEAAKIGLSDDYGAHHLAPAEEGPAGHWRLFTAALDAVDLTETEDARVIFGAEAAFDRVQAIVDDRLG